MKSKITELQREWIRKHYTEFRTIKEIHEAFNTEFDQDICFGTFSSFLSKTLKIRINKNKGKFRNGESARALPIGTIKKTRYGTYIKVKEDTRFGDVKRSGYSKPYWIPLQEKVYQEKYGPIPAGCFICFLDGNRNNFAAENLHPINRKISAYLAKNKLWKKDDEQTKTAILLAELVQQIGGQQ